MVRSRDQLGWLGCDVATVVSRAARCAANQPTTVLLRIQQPSNLLYDGVVVLRSTGVSCVSHYAVVSPQVGAVVCYALPENKKLRVWFGGPRRRQLGGHSCFLTSNAVMYACGRWLNDRGCLH